MDVCWGNGGALCFDSVKKLSVQLCQRVCYNSSMPSAAGNLTGYKADLQRMQTHNAYGTT